MTGLSEQVVKSPEAMIDLIKFGSSVRQTHATASNDTSSRSHAVCTIRLYEMTQDSHGHEKRTKSGTLLLVDLAGSERAQDTQHNNKERRAEGAEINKSLLALKECIRAMDNKVSGGHIPFRQTKLTMVLRDSFIGDKNQSRIIMIACINPGKSSCDHTLNTLRYAERLKERANSHNVVQRYMRNKYTPGPDFYPGQDGEELSENEYDDVMVVEEETKQHIIDDEIMIDSENFDEPECADEILYDPNEY